MATITTNTNDNHVTEFSSISPPSTPSPSIPLHLSGFLSGDTIQVRGDTGELQFSVQFNVHKKEHNYVGPFNSPDTNIPEIETFRDSVQAFSSSSYLTPTYTDHEFQDQNAETNSENEEVKEVSSSRSAIVTRLRSRVLSPVKYNDTGTHHVFMGSFSSGKRKKKGKGRSKMGNLLNKMLKRRSFPLRPCNAYAFFLMANWGAVKCSSFEEKSKRLSKKWCKLPHDIKKEYEGMAFKDSARYKRQCMLLKNDVEQEILAVDYQQDSA